MWPGRRLTAPGRALARTHAALLTVEHVVNEHYLAWQLGSTTPLKPALDTMYGRWLALRPGERLTLEWPVAPRSNKRFDRSAQSESVCYLQYDLRARSTAALDPCGRRETMVINGSEDAISLRPISYFVILYAIFSGWAIISLWHQKPTFSRGALWSVIIAIPFLGPLFYAGFYSPPPHYHPASDRVSTHMLQWEGKG